MRAGTQGYCGGRNQSDLSVSSCELGQSATLRLTFLLCLSWNNRLSPICAPPVHLPLSPPTDKRPLSVCFPSLFLSQKSHPNSQPNELIYRKVGVREKRRGCMKGRVGTAAVLYMRRATKLKLLRWWLSKTCVWRKEAEISPASSPPVVFCVAAGEEWLDSGVQEHFGLQIPSPVKNWKYNVKFFF